MSVLAPAQTTLLSGQRQKDVDEGVGGTVAPGKSHFLAALAELILGTAMSAFLSDHFGPD